MVHGPKITVVQMNPNDSAFEIIQVNSSLNALPISGSAPGNITATLSKNRQEQIVKGGYNMFGYHHFSCKERWEQLAVSSAQNGAAVSDNFDGMTFDGRYVYFTPSSGTTFIRYDTTSRFGDNIASWQQIPVSSAQGNTEVAEAYNGCTFDGRYVYYAPQDSLTFVRFDTTLSFISITSWQQISTDSAGTAWPSGNAHYGCTFDGRYIYFSAHDGGTFVRYDSTLPFTAITSWQQMSVASAQGAAAVGGDFAGPTFLNGYVYFAPNNSETLVRFDTTQAFTALSSWQQMRVSSAQGATITTPGFLGASTCGRYIYYSPQSNQNRFIRFDAAQLFTNPGAWQNIQTSSVVGSASLPTYVCSNATCDGRYVYFACHGSSTAVRYDTTQPFTLITAWQKIALNSAQGGAAVANDQYGVTYDGYWVYYTPGDASTIARFRANSTAVPGSAEFAQIST